MIASVLAFRSDQIADEKSCRISLATQSMSIKHARLERILFAPRVLKLEAIQERFRPGTDQSPTSQPTVGHKSIFFADNLILLLVF